MSFYIHFAVLLSLAGANGKAPEVGKHPSRVIIGYSDTCNTSAISALRKSSLVSTDEVAVITKAMSSGGATVSAADSLSVEGRRSQSLLILASLLSVRNNGNQAGGTVASISANSEKLSKQYFGQLKMEVIEDPEGKHSSDQLAALARVLPCMQFAPEPDFTYSKEDFFRDVPPVEQITDNFGNATSTSATALAPDAANRVLPNDTYFPSQWSMKNGKLPEAWSAFTGASKGLTVAVVDTGCSFHPDLAPNFWVDPQIKACAGADAENPKFADGCYGIDAAGNGSPLVEVREHGTRVAGVISAVTNNEFGLSGVCWGCKIAGVKVADKEGIMSTSSLLKAYDYIMKKKFKVSNHSYSGYIWGDHDDLWSFQIAFQKMASGDHLAIASAGNKSCDVDNHGEGAHPCKTNGQVTAGPPYPASDRSPHVITVGAINKSLQISSISNFGQKSVDVFAPGSHVEVLRNTFLGQLGFADRMTKSASGTSFAAPFVAGVVAMIWGAYPNFTADEVKKRLMDTVVKHSVFNGKCVSGGYVDAQAAIGSNPPQTDGPKEFPKPKKDMTSMFYKVTATTTPNAGGIRLTKPSSLANPNFAGGTSVGLITLCAAVLVLF